MNFEVKNAPGVIFVNDNLQDNFLKRRRRRNKKYRLVKKRYKKNK